MPEQNDRLVGGSRLILARLFVQFASRAKRFCPSYIGIPTCSDRLDGGLPLLQAIIQE